MGVACPYKASVNVQTNVIHTVAGCESFISIAIRMLSDGPSIKLSIYFLQSTSVRYDVIVLQSTHVVILHYSWYLANG